MSLILRIRGADFSNRARPELQPYRFGFPATGLRGLYLMEEGTVGVRHIGNLFDSSGNNNHAAVGAGYTQPVKRSYGMELAAGGLALAAPVEFGSKWTAVLAMQANEPIPAGTVYPYVLGPASKNPVAPASAVALAATDTVVNSMVVTNGTSNWGLFTPTGTWPGNPSAAQTSANNFRPALQSVATGWVNQPSLLGVTYDNDSGAFILKQGGAAYRATRAGLWTPTELFGFGWMPYNSGAVTVAAGAKLFLAGMWSGSSEALLDEVMGVALARLTARGITGIN